ATLQIGNGGTTGTLGTNQVFNDGTLAFNRSDTFTVNNSLSGNGALRKDGAGTLILTADSNLAGGATVTGGTLQLGNGGVTGGIGDVPMSVSNGATLAFNHGNDISFSGVISGQGGVLKSGTGRTQLNGNSTYFGPTLVP